jgi:tRNA A58 N-methylase Trm61
VPTPWKVVDEMLSLAGVNAEDFVMDLGSGDGRLVIKAAQHFGARGCGIELNPELVKLARDNADKAGVANRARFEQGNLFEAALSEATVLTLYLLPGVEKKLVPKIFAELKPGARVVAHDYPLEPWQCERYIEFDVPEKVEINGTTRTVLYLYCVKA